MAYKGGSGVGVVDCAIDVQQYCSSADNAGVGGGNRKMIDSYTKALK